MRASQRRETTGVRRRWQSTRTPDNPHVRLEDAVKIAFRAWQIRRGMVPDDDIPKPSFGSIKTNENHDY